MEDLRRLFLSNLLARLFTEGRSRNTTEGTSVSPSSLPPPVAAEVVEVVDDVV